MHSRAQQPVQNRTSGSVAISGGRLLPGTVRFKDGDRRGLIIRAWVNGAGPFDFAVDTGAGATLLSPHVAQAAHVQVKTGRSISISGLSGTGTVAGREAFVRTLAIGGAENLLPAKGQVMVTERLPSGVDGILDPTEAYWPLGYTIDMPQGEIRAFDPAATPLTRTGASGESAVVSWLFDHESRRPYIVLSNGQRALIDTGSGFGLAVGAHAASAFGIEAERGRERGGTFDLGGGRFSSRRVNPVNIQIGSLMLKRIPTQLLSDVEAGTPVLLGREALAPFELSFDPLHRLIRIAPAREH
ncbi:MAG TPA: aspartyl protease family protein [Pyrinomonadaceae bacterium]|jgi:hypothetical protein